MEQENIVITAFHITRPDAPEYPAYFSDREIATSVASAIKGNSIMPVTFDIKKPFINTPDDQLMELNALRRILDDVQIYGLVKSQEDDLMATNQWERLKEKHGSSLTFDGLYRNHPEDFLTLPIDCHRFFTRAAVAAIIAAHGFDGAIFSGKGFHREATMYVPFNRLGVRYGEEKYVS